MNSYQTRAILLLLTAVLLAGCETRTSSGTQPAIVIDNDARIVIRDIAGQDWDVTHAVRRYGFEAKKFEHGLGKNAIRPLIHPRFLSPGDGRYPADDAVFLVLGVDIGGDVRAYPLFEFSFHEVANEVYAGQAVAPAY